MYNEIKNKQARSTQGFVGKQREKVQKQKGREGEGCTIVLW